ncbi:MAG: tRNA epoxyqueuosine(34) reductase QueG, partial [Bosea sp. (in: a-proteobacteria)]|nr:tRNA epoxyqueuosine(34) reductase QueG [Bosea sp. (in: a-proteobacteria)]
ALALLADPSPLVRAMAVWALIRLDPPQARSLAGRALAMEKDEEVRREWLALPPAMDAAS